MLTPPSEGKRKEGISHLLSVGEEEKPHRLEVRQRVKDRTPLSKTDDLAPISL